MNIENYKELNNDNTLIENTIDVEKIILLRNKIVNLSKSDMIEIFKIIKNNNHIYTENKNGIFINMNQLTLKTINEIEDLIKYLLDKNNNLNNDIAIRQNIKDIVENVVINSNITNNLNYYDQNLNKDKFYNEVTNEVKTKDLLFNEVLIPKDLNQLQFKMLGLSK